LHGKVTQSFICLTVRQIAESQNVLTAELNVHLPRRCWTNRSWEQTSVGVRSDFQYQTVLKIRKHAYTEIWNSLPQTVLINDSPFLNADFSRFYWTLIWPAASACWVTTVWPIEIQLLLSPPLGKGH